MFNLTGEKIAEYRQKGYILIPELFTREEIKIVQDECTRLTVKSNLALLDPLSISFYENLMGHRVCYRIDPIVNVSSVFQNLLKEQKLLTIISNLLEDKPYLFKDKLIIKPPQTKGFGLHQDYFRYRWTGVNPEQIISVQIAIDDADHENGAISFYPNQHHQLFSVLDHNIESQLFDYKSSELIKTKAGDVIIFHSLTPHWSDANHSQKPRRTLYLTYNSSQCGDLYSTYYQERGTILNKI